MLELAGLRRLGQARSAVATGLHSAGIQSARRAPCRPSLVSQTRCISDVVSPPVALLQPPAKFPPCPCLFRALPSKPSSLSLLLLQLCLNSHACTIVNPAQPIRYLVYLDDLIATTHSALDNNSPRRVPHKPRRLLSNLVELRRAHCKVCA
jgi:hypothetical protein